MGKLTFIFLLSALTINPCFAQQGWFSVSAGHEYTHIACSFINADTGWVVKEVYGVKKTMDGGNEWADQNINYADKPGDLQFINVNTGWLCGSNKSIFKTTDSGENWQLKLSNTSPDYYFAHLSSICFLDENIGYCAGYQYNIKTSAYESILMKSTNGGEEWTPQSAGAHNFVLTSVFFINETIGWVCSYGGKIFKTINGGTEWIEQDSKTNLDLSSIFFINEQKGWSVGGKLGGGNIILMTSNGGTTWTSQSSPASGLLTDVQFLNENIGYACGQDGTILKTLEGGLDWHLQVSGSAAGLADLCFLSPDTGYCVGSEGTILKTVNGGVGTNSVDENNITLPNKYYLNQNFPNPFNPATTIRYNLPKTCMVELTVFCPDGRKLTTLVSENQAPGIHSVNWDISKFKGLASGIYCYRLSAGQFTQTKKMIFLK